MEVRIELPEVIEMKVGEIMKALQVTPGMKIYGSDSTVIGIAAEIWIETESHGHLPVSRYLVQSYGPVRGTTQMLAGDSGYVQIRRTTKFGMRRTDLWVPLQAVAAVDGHRAATLRLEASRYEQSQTPQSDLVRRAA